MESRESAGICPGLRWEPRRRCGSQKDRMSGDRMRRLTADTPISMDDSMINLRPSFGNRSRGVDAAATRDAIAALVTSLVRR